MVKTGIARILQIKIQYKLLINFRIEDHLKILTAEPSTAGTIISRQSHVRGYVMSLLGSTERGSDGDIFNTG